jgi:hypothetical protein
MRIATSVSCACFVLLAACGGPQTSQANNAQANISDQSRVAPTANESNATVNE